MQLHATQCNPMQQHVNAMMPFTYCSYPVLSYPMLSSVRQRFNGFNKHIHIEILHDVVIRVDIFVHVKQVGEQLLGLADGFAPLRVRVHVCKQQLHVLND